MDNVGSCVSDGFPGKRTQSPVGFLQFFTLLYGYSQQVTGEGRQAEPGDTGGTGGDAGIEQVVNTESAVPVETAYIIVRGVDNLRDGGIRENIPERREVIENYRVNEVYLAAGGNLYQTELLRVVVQTVGLGIERDNIRFC